MAEFTIPHKIIYGAGCTDFLASIPGKRMLIVTDCPDAIQPVKSKASGGGLSTRTFLLPRGAVESHTVSDGTKALMEFKPDWTVALGGRGAMDCAKLICGFYQRPELSEADLVAGRAKDLTLTKTRLISIPLLNTDGGEAMGQMALLQGQSESVIQCMGLLPEVTLTDPSLLEYCPKEEDSFCVLSSLALILESATHPESSCFTMPYTIEALKLIANSVMAYSDAPARRDQLQLAQLLSGIASFNSGTGLCSAMVRAASVFGLKFHFGQGAAIFLPAVIRAAENPAVYDTLTRAIGLQDSGSSSDALSSMAEEYADMLGLFLSLEELGLEKNEFLKRLPYASRHAAQAPGIMDTLGEDAQKRIEELYRACYPSIS